MYFIKEDRNVSAFSEECIENKYFEFIPNKEDYILSYNVSWDEILTDVYQFVIGRETFMIPAGTYLFCGDEYGVTDWILSDEIIGRGIPVFTSNIDMNGWRSHVPQLVNTFPEKFYYPLTKNPIPVTNARGKMTLITSRVDQYHRLGQYDIASFFM